jgi:hypothetical protein
VALCAVQMKEKSWHTFFPKAATPDVPFRSIR